jgi:DNA-binding LacI/PurR family transcriptional regulator
VLDNVEAARGITKHVIGLGHRRIGFIAGPTNTSNAWERLQGFRAALTEAGIPHQDCLIREGYYNTDFGVRVGQEFLKLSNPPSAIVASNDVIALGILQAAGDFGIQVPEDLSVAGLDNIQVAGHFGIQLTTMDAHVAEQAKLAANWILEIINDPDRFARQPFQHVIQATLVVRRTCGSPRAQRPHGHRQSLEHG